MKTRSVSPAALVIFLFTIASFAFGVGAQIGEVAGQPVFNVSAGGTQTLNITLLNSGDAPIGYSAIPPSLNTIPNETTPTVTISPMSGVIAPHGQFKVAITVSIPLEDKPGLAWTGPVQFLQASNVSNPGGAVLQVGALKILTIYSKKAVFRIDLLFEGLAAAVIIVGCAAYLIMGRKKRKRSEAAAAPQGSRHKPRRPKKAAKGRRAKRR